MIILRAKRHSRALFDRASAYGTQSLQQPLAITGITATYCPTQQLKATNARSH